MNREIQQMLCTDSGISVGSVIIGTDTVRILSEICQDVTIEKDNFNRWQSGIVNEMPGLPKPFRDTAWNIIRNLQRNRFMNVEEEKAGEESSDQ